MKEIIKNPIIKLISFIFLIILTYTSNIQAQDIIEAVRTGNLEKVRELIDNDPSLLESKDHNPLIEACVALKVEVANFLIDKGANVNARGKYGETPLYCALRYDESESLELIQRLIDKGADVNAKVSYLTILQRTAGTNNLRVAKLLINHGAEVNVRDITGTILHSAINSKNEDMAKLLIENGATLQEYSYGNTELHLAALKGCADLVQPLVKHGADINAVNDYGHTPLCYAARHGYRKMTDVLIAAGADENTIVENNFSTPPQLKEKLNQSEAYLWYLGSNGYVVKTKEQLLIFNPPENAFGFGDSLVVSLTNGYLNPNELENQNITILRTRYSRFGSSVSELAQRLPGAKFVLSFNPIRNNEDTNSIPPYQLATPYKSFSIGEIQVHTILASGEHSIEKNNSLGYLVEVDGVKIFHAGLHASSNEADQVAKYRKEIDFLKTFGPIDIAILPINGRHTNIAYEPYLYLIDQLAPKAVYLNGDDLVTEEHLKCIKVLKTHDTPVFYPDGGIAMGQRFHYNHD